MAARGKRASKRPAAQRTRKRSGKRKAARVRQRERATETPARRNSKKPPPPEPAAARSLGQRMHGARRRGSALWGRVRGPLLLVGRLAIVALIAAGAVAVGRLVERHVRTSEAFAVRGIALAGDERLAREDVLTTAGLAIGENVFDVAPEEARARLLAHPWVAEAEVRRRLPGAFELEIREHEPVAVLAMPGDVDVAPTLYLVSDDGTVFKRLSDDDPVDLPVITGLDPARFTSDRTWRTGILLEVVAMLHDWRGAGLWRREPIGEVHVEPDDGLSLWVGGAGEAEPTEVRLGRPPFRRKLGRLRNVLDRLQREESRAAYVYLDNVRRPDRVTVRLRED